MASQDQILQAEVNTAWLLNGSAVFLLQASANYLTSGYAAAAFPTKIDDIVNLSGAAIGTAKTANGWRNIGHTGDITLTPNRTTADINSNQVRPARVVHDLWEYGITVAAMETSDLNMIDFLQSGDAAAVSVSGGAVAQFSIDFGVPTVIPVRRCAVLFPDPEGRLWAWVFSKAVITVTSGPTFAPGATPHVWAINARPTPDTRIADVNDRMGRIYYTTVGFLTAV